jgi:hypothetical protein
LGFSDRNLLVGCDVTPIGALNCSFAEPERRIELLTYALRVRCSAV